MSPPQNSIPFTLTVALLLFSAATSLVAAQSQPPPPDCFQALVNLSDCLTFFEKGSNLAQPDPGCCPGLSSMVQTQPDCFCKLIGGRGNGQIQMPIDAARARDLPATCHVSNSLTKCVGGGSPTGSMDGSPGNASSTNAPLSGTVTPAGNDISFAGISRYYAINYHLLICISTLMLSLMFCLI